jgi:branched-chain amino acid transport system substrate-binding protein
MYVGYFIPKKEEKMDIGRAKKIGYWALMIGPLLFLILGTTAAQGWAQTLKIGVIQPLSGPMALLGKYSLEGSEVARVEQNGKGGLLGKKIEFIIVDAPDAKAAAAAAEKLITLDKVTIIMGTYSSALSYAATNAANKYGVVYWELGAIADDITLRGFKYIFRTCSVASDFSYSNLQCTAEYLAPKLGKKPGQIRMGQVYEDGIFGSTGAKYGTEAAKKYGVKIVADVPYNAKSADLTPVILKLKAASPDILLYSGFFNDTVLFFRQSKELGFDFKIALAIGGVGLKDFGKALGDDADGVTIGGFTAMDVNPQYAPGVRDFDAMHVKVLGKEADGAFPLMNYMGTKVLFKAIQMAGSLEPEAVRKAAMAIDIPYQGTQTGGGVKFDPKTGQNLRAVAPISQWQKGKMPTVWPEKAASAKMIFPVPTWAERKKK